jgi:hypothetical protein
MTFDRGNLDVKRHNVAWKNSLNAANFAAAVADVCITQYAVLSPASPTADCRNFLAAVRQLATSAPSLTFAPPIFAQFAAWHPNATEGRALKSLLELVHRLYWYPARSATAIANDAGRWVYTWALDTTVVTESDVEQIEMQYRITDRVVPPSTNCIHAFEAVWVLGKFRDAIKLLHRKC